ncbi:MAG: SDR family oxidoreductase [SAR324 cluster bacterium]|nr:SDR family oxidoreductase [SAR324 cluster bacterium]
MSASIENVVLITGASSGIGAALACRLARPGIAMLLHARGGVNGDKRDLLAQRAAEARKAGAEVEIKFSDLLEDGVGKDLVSEALKHFGRIDQIVCNAGFADRRLFGELTASDFDKAYKGMARAFFEIATAAIEPLSKSSRGRLVAVSSFVAHVYAEGGLFPITAAAKAGIESLSKSLALQIAPHGVTVNCVAPGYTRKESSGHSALSEEAWKRAADKTPLGRIAEPCDIAAAIAFLLSDDARHITGQVIHVDGGLTLA